MIFAVCYWVLDHASQQARCANRDYTSVFVFPQNQTKYPGYEDWIPGFTDYLFFAFNTALEFGPTNTLILVRRAKYLVMAEVTLSLLVILVLAARAIGLIH